MTKKIFIAAISLFILAALVAGCRQAISPPSPSLPAGPQAPATPPVSPSAPSIPVVPPPAPDDSGSVVQAGLSVEVTQPVDGSNLNTNTVTVEGQTAPGAVVIVNDQADIADEQGNFSIAISLESGINLISVAASDDNGNQAEVILMVNVAGS